MPPLLQIRTATIDDLNGIARAQFSSWMKAYTGLLAPDFLASLSARSFEAYHAPRFGADGQPRHDEPFLVAVDSGEIIGFARGGPVRPIFPTGDAIPPSIVRDHPAELQAIYVDADRQRAGAGRALLLALREELARVVPGSMCLWVLAENTPSRHFYERLGGRVVDSSTPDGTPTTFTLAGVGYPHVAYAYT
jgi:GNAT superfamily N-acetyltransferase